jgi:transcriptional regulator with XRE-family HTH domain
MEAKSKNKVGRPKKYDPKVTPQLAKWMRRSGLTDEQMSKELGISVATIHNWKNKYPEFLESLKESKDFVDSLVEDCLLKRALGFDYEEVKMIAKKEESGESKVTRIEKIKKKVVPDTTAQIFWLKNRKPGQWREKVETSGKHAESLAETLSKMADRLPG